MQKRTLLAALFAAAGLLSAAGFSPACAAERVYVAAMDAAYPPFGSQDMKTGKYVGYDVDIIEAIARSEGLKVTVRNMAFDGLIPALISNNIDIAINDITITPERAKRVAEDLLREEKNARIRLKEELPRVFGDSLCRALAILKNCRLLSAGELFDLLSPMRLAAKEKMLDGITLAEIERMMNDQDLSNSEDRLSQDERDRVDAERADEMNKRFEEVMLDDVL